MNTHVKLDGLEGAVAWPGSVEPEFATAITEYIEREVAGIMNSPDGFDADKEGMDRFLSTYGNSNVVGAIVQRVVVRAMAKVDYHTAARYLDKLDQLKLPPKTLEPALQREIDDAAADNGA
jgi:hypothetical protein